MEVKSVFSAALLLLASLSSALANPVSIDIRDTWSENSGEERATVLPGAGFSFAYDGVTVGPEISDDWQRVVRSDPDGGAEVQLVHASGLVVTREVRRFPAFNAIEYKLSFKNAGKKTLPRIARIRALHLAFEESAFDGACVISSGGGLADGVMPPRTFAIQRRCLPSRGDWAAVSLTTEGGRSSDKDLPFFFVHNDTRRAGIFAAFGWTGQWSALAFLDGAKGALRVMGNIPDLSISLEPGEEIQGPTILVGVYKGTLADGSNRLRRLLREAYTPKLAGRQFLPTAVYDHFYNVGVDFDEALLKRLADGAAAVGQEVFLLDAGWFDGAGKVSNDILDAATFSAGLGNWDKVDKRKLPNGLAPVADYVRSKGMKFGLWFEPERVSRGSDLAKEHPDWVLWDHAEESENSFNASVNPAHGLLDYGRPEVQQWVRDMLDRYIRQYGLNYIRYDFNMDPLPYWRANDPPQRRGMTQLRHIQGLYAVLDWLHARHPDVILEGCASGGRRIDLETVRRFHTMYISDYSFDSAIVRFHLFGISYFLPGNYSTIFYARFPARKDVKQTDFPPDAVGFQSLFAGAAGSGGRVDLWPEAMKQDARLHVETWKGIRRYLIEDYYPLSPQPTDIKSWSGWQFHDPKDQSGFIQSFRTGSPETSHTFVLHGLEVDAQYEFTDAYTKETLERRGADVMTSGITLMQDPDSSRVLTYRRSSK